VIQAAEPAQSKPAGMQFPTSDSPGTAASAGSARTHKVKKGETLSHISQQYYGKASQYMKIFEANKDQLNDPDKIREGMTLKIPQ
jgi:nucleoid-associated protein YgaU